MLSGVPLRPSSGGAGRRNSLNGSFTTCCRVACSASRACALLACALMAPLDVPLGAALPLRAPLLARLPLARLPLAPMLPLPAATQLTPMLPLLAVALLVARLLGTALPVLPAASLLLLQLRVADEPLGVARLSASQLLVSGIHSNPPSTSAHSIDTRCEFWRLACHGTLLPMLLRPPRLLRMLPAVASRAARAASAGLRNSKVSAGHQGAAELVTEVAAELVAVDSVPAELEQVTASGTSALL